MPNYSFEQHSGCDFGGVSTVVSDWKYHSYASPDYYNPCNNEYGNVPTNQMGYQEPKDGNAYVGIYAYSTFNPMGREYIIVELTDTIIKGIPYLVKFHVNCVNMAQYAIQYKMGAYLSTEVPTFDVNDFFIYTPQILNNANNPLTDTSAWIMVADTFVSNIGGEKYISIGNFFDNANSDTVSIGDGVNFYSLSYYYVDDVWVTPLDSGVGIGEIEDVKFEIYPNPAPDKLTIQTEINKNTNLQLLDITGRSVFTTSLSAATTNVDIAMLPVGVYTAVLMQNGAVAARRKIIIQ